jgi:site-specific recombinase XerD
VQLVFPYFVSYNLRVRDACGSNSAVECLLPKQKVASSNLVSRSNPSLAICLPKNSVEQHLARYRLQARARGYSDATINHSENCVREFAAFLGASDVTRITGDDLRRFVVSLKERPSLRGRRGSKLSPVSVNTYVRAVRSFWTWLKETGVVRANPLVEVPAPRFPKKVARVYPEDQIRTLLGYVAAKPRERAIVELLLDSGIRVSELAGLRVDDIDLEQGSVKVLGKGGKERYSYFSPGTALSLRDYIDKSHPPAVEGDYLFLTGAGSRLGKMGIQTLLARLGRAAGLTTRLSAHAMRHTYATLSLRNGNNLEYVRITLGHTDIKTTSDAYLAASQADVARAHHRFSPMANLTRKRGARRLPQTGCR